MKNSLFLLAACCLIQQNYLFAQSRIELPKARVQEIRQDGFTLSWELEEPLEAWVEWRAAHNGLSGKAYLEKFGKHYHWNYQEGEPARFYSARFVAVKDGDTLSTEPEWFSTRSLSSGEIRVYFNHPADHSVATETPAVYLNKTVDDTLIAYLNRARETIDIAIYNTTSSASISNIAAALNNAHARGVQVRMVYNASTANTMIPNVNVQIGRIVSKTGESFGIMHNKFVVIDADAEDANQALVWTGSTNWTVDQMNGPDENNAILVQDQALARAYKIEFEEMYGSSGAQPNPSNARFGPEKQNNTPHEFNVGGKRVRSYFSPSDGTNAQILGVINSAQSDLEFASMVITRYDLANAISNKISQGLTEVYGITDDSAASAPAPVIWQQLRSDLRFNRMLSHNGQSGIMHHKFVIADALASGSDPQVLTGSHNWSNAAEQKNDENTLIVHDAGIVNQYYQAFAWLFKNMSGGRSVGIQAGGLNESAWKFYPNPARGIVRISRPSEAQGEGTFRLMDLSGRVLLSHNFKANESQFEMNLEGIQSGIYLLETGVGKQVLRLMIGQ